MIAINTVRFMYNMNAMHVGDLDLTQIRLLAELSRSHSVSRAAHRIGVSQSAASHALAKLRKKLVDPLFTRIHDRFEPTPFGARLGNASCEALDALLAGLASRAVPTARLPVMSQSRRAAMSAVGPLTRLKQPYR